MTGPTVESTDAKRYRFLRDHPEIRIVFDQDMQRYVVIKAVEPGFWTTVLDHGGYATHELAVDAALMAER